VGRCFTTSEATSALRSIKRSGDQYTHIENGSGLNCMKIGNPRKARKELPVNFLAAVL